MDMRQKPESSAKEAAEPKVNAYPYGLKIRLEKEQLVKLGFKALPKVGDKFEVDAMCVVDSVSASESSSGGDYKSVELQIVDLEMEEGGESDVANKLYGGK